jgi:hypothetical protein
MLTKEQAIAATNPQDPDTVREESALKLMMGSLANDVYWASRGELEQLWAKVNGHGIVTRVVDDAAKVIAAGEQDRRPAIESALEGTATDVKPTPLGSTVPSPHTEPTNDPNAQTVDDAAARLRKQLEAAGITPEA